LHDLALIKLIAARFVCTGCILNRYSKQSYEMSTSPIKDFPRLFLTKHYSFNWKSKETLK